MLEELDRLKGEARVSVEIVLVDDSCPHPDTPPALRCCAEKRDWVRLLTNETNRGKGYAVSRGMLAAAGRFRVFTDADLAYPISEIWKVVDSLEAGADVAIACRTHPQSEYLMSALYLRYIYTRHVMSRLFNAVVRALNIVDVHDTQAGLKGFTGSAATRLFPLVRIDGFGFDLELLFLAKTLHMRIDEVPVRFHYRDEPTTVQFIADGRRLLGDLVRIRWRSFTGEYRVPRRSES